MDRMGLVVHPTRDLRRALATIAEWATAHGVEIVQIPAPGAHRQVENEGDVAACDLVLALGGDGTTLVALHAAAGAGKPVLGVACGSLGVLTSTVAERLAPALEAIAAGHWTHRRLPALSARYGDQEQRAINDLVLIRAGAGQVIVEVEIDGDLLVRFAGDGIVAGTPFGSSAYTLASGGPLLAPGTAGLVVTPLAPHGGVCPPAVTAPDSAVTVRLEPGHGGARVEVDGRIVEQVLPDSPREFALSWVPEYATLVMLGDQERPLAGLRRRRIILDSPRVLARDDRAAAAAAEPAPAP
jgi:NAD+ kinase